MIGFLPAKCGSVVCFYPPMDNNLVFIGVLAIPYRRNFFRSRTERCVLADEIFSAVAASRSVMSSIVLARSNMEYATTLLLADVAESSERLKVGWDCSSSSRKCCKNSFPCYVHGITLGFSTSRILG